MARDKITDAVVNVSVEGLNDTPDFTDQGGKFLKINSAGDEIEYEDASESLLIANNLSDVNNQQTALDNITNVSSGTVAQVLTKNDSNLASWEDVGGSSAQTIEVDNITGTYTIDLDDGSVFDLTMTADTTLTFPTSSDGTAGELGEFFIYLKQNATGGYTITWDVDVNWAMNIVPNLDKTLSTMSIFRFTQLGASDTWYGECLGMGYAI